MTQPIQLTAKQRETIVTPTSQALTKALREAGVNGRVVFSEVVDLGIVNVLFKVHARDHILSAIQFGMGIKDLERWATGDISDRADKCAQMIRNCIAQRKAGF